MRDLQQIVLATLKAGAPGLSERTREVLAATIARKVSLPAPPKRSELDCTEAQFESLVTLHMLAPEHVLTEDECWAIEHTRCLADAVENSAIDAFEQGRKHGIQSIAGKTDAAMFAEIERLQTELAVEKAMNTMRLRSHSESPA